MVRHFCKLASVLSALSLLCWASAGLAAAQTPPEEVLKTHELRPAGSLYVLELETEVQKQANELRVAARKLKLAQTRQRAAGSPEEYQKAIKDLGDQVQGYQQEIQATTMRMNSLPRYTYGRFGTAYSNQTYSQLLAYRNQMQMQLSLANGSLKQLKNQPFDKAAKQKLDAAVQEEQQAYDEALGGLRKLVDSASEKYAELQKNSTVTKALYTLAKTAKVKPKLGPSPHYQATVKLLEKLEKQQAANGGGDSDDGSSKADQRSSRSRRGRATDSPKPAGGQ
jgi:predicted  nucleic acid-binding Zn-ribbon protein